MKFVPAVQISIETSHIVAKGNNLIGKSAARREDVKHGAQKSVSGIPTGYTHTSAAADNVAITFHVARNLGS